MSNTYLLAYQTHPKQFRFVIVTMLNYSNARHIEHSTLYKIRILIVPSFSRSKHQYFFKWL